ncbi:MAG TPA: hypothetical protein VN345_04385 [Blastocatellia bacterium]|jgi:hypothetical protein|nr:hypothetical protein [Blastocatellia bacterium]
MSFDYKVDLVSLANEALENAATNVLQAMFGKAAQYAMDDKLREVIRQKALEILNEPEMTALLRQRVKDYIHNAEAMGDKKINRY